MSFLARLSAFLGPRQEAPAAPAGLPLTQPAIPVLAIGDADAAAAPDLLVRPTPAMLRALGVPDAEAWAAALAPACRSHGITTRDRLAAFLAQVGHESAGFRRLAESLDYTPEALRLMWPSRFDADLAWRLGRRSGHPAEQQQIAEIAYGGRLGNRPAGAGDGWAFRGRGLLQHSGREGYELVARWAGLPVAEVAGYLEAREGAAESAAHWWSEMGCNELADAGAFDSITRRINGGTNGATDRQRRWAAAREVVEVA
jgi:putative chitinase